MASEDEISQFVVNGSLGCDELSPTTPPASLHLNGGDGGPSVLNGTIDSSAIDDSVLVSPPSIPSTSNSSTPSQQPLPTYDDIFPALPGGGGPFLVSAAHGGGISSAYGIGGISVGHHSATGRLGRGPAPTGTAPKIRSSNVTKIYRVSPEERRANTRRFGEQSELTKICTDIMSKTGTDIQLTTTKDGTLNFLITGKDEATNKAHRLLVSEFQAPIIQQLSIPKEHHRFILGKGGKKLSEMEQTTGTRIQIPKQDEDSDVIRITGPREAIDKVVHEIQLISNEALSRHIERIQIPKIYHPFITGPFGRLVDAINKETGAKVNRSILN